MGISDKQGWQTLRFDQIAHSIAERIEPAQAETDIYVGLEHLDPESLKIRRWGTPDDVKGTKLRFYKGDIIFGRRRAYQRKLAVAEFDGICSAHALVLRANEENVLPEFLPFFMQSDTFFDRALQISVGSLSPTINWTTLARQEFTLPPKAEQRRIADILWAAEEAIETQLSALDRLDICKRVVTTDLLRNGLGRKSLVSTKLGKILASWEITNLGKITDVSYGLTINAARRGLQMKLPYLRVANVFRNRLDLSELKTIGSTEEDITRFGLQTNDVLVVEGHANPNEIGRAAMWTGEVEVCLHQNHIFRARCSRDLNPEYLLAYLNSPRGRLYFKKHAKSTSGLNTINSQVLNKMPIVVPTLKEQQSIVEVVQNFEKQKQVLEIHISRLVEVKKSLGTEFLAKKIQGQ